MVAQSAGRPTMGAVRVVASRVPIHRAAAVILAAVVEARPMAVEAAAVVGRTSKSQ